MQLTILGLPFEAQKAWLDSELSQDQIEYKVQMIEEIESYLFGGNIIWNKTEAKDCYKYLFNLFSKENWILSNWEKYRFNSYLESLKVFIWDNEDLNIAGKPPISLEDSPLIDKLVDRSDYVEIFKLVFQIYWINKPIIIDERSSIYDREDALFIPSSQAYETLKLQRVLQLIQHEIETHYIIQDNNEKLLWNFRWWNNLLREEWVAMVSEWLLFWKELTDFWVSKRFPMIFAWEMLCWEEYLDFVKLLCKMNWESNIEWIYLRRKRNYPLNYRWVQHKDTTYSRWIQKVIEYIREWNDLKDLFIGKLSFEDLNLGKNIAVQNSIKLKYPIFIWELILFVLNWNKLSKSSFQNYLKNKYPFVFEQIWDEVLKLNELSFSNKKKLVEILKILGKK